MIFVVDSAVTKISPYDYMYMYYDYNAHESDDDISKRVQYVSLLHPRTPKPSRGNAILPPAQTNKSTQQRQLKSKSVH